MATATSFGAAQRPGAVHDIRSMCVRNRDTLAAAREQGPLLADIVALCERLAASGAR